MGRCPNNKAENCFKTDRGEKLEIHSSTGTGKKGKLKNRGRKDQGGQEK